MENQSKKMVQIVYDALDEKLGEDIEILKVDEISVIADYLVIACLLYTSDAADD